MPWSNDQFTGTLVIPTGATSGVRIVLDGTTGDILVYDAANQVVYRISGSIPGAAAGPAGGSQVITEYTGTSARVAFPMNSPAENGRSTVSGSVTGSGTNLEQLFLTLRGPTTTPNTDRLDLVLSSENVLGTIPARLRLLLNGTTSLITADVVNGIALAFTEIIAGIGDPHALKVQVPGAFAGPAIEVDNGSSVFAVAANGAVTPSNMQWGTATTAAPGVGGGTSTVTVNFPNTFPNTPRVVISPRTTVDPATVQIVGYTDNVGTTSFDIRAFRSTNSSTNWSWYAVSD